MKPWSFSSDCQRTDQSKPRGKRVIKRLGCLALAVDQAGAYISARRLDFDSFMDHFHNRRERVFKEIPANWDYRKKINEAEAERLLNIATTWELSFDQISGDVETRDSKKHLLTLAAFFNNQCISEDLFRVHHQTPTWITTIGVPERLFRTNDMSEMPSPMTLFVHQKQWNQYQFSDVIAEFRKLSLVQSMGVDNGSTFISLHPLIQDWMKLRLGVEDRQKYVTESRFVLSGYIGQQDIDAMALQARQTTVAHLDTLLEDHENDQTRGELPATSAHTFALFYE